MNDWLKEVEPPVRTSHVDNIRAFLDSGLKCVRYPVQDTNTRVIVSNAIRRTGLSSQLKVAHRSGVLYLMRTNAQ